MVTIEELVARRGEIEERGGKKLTLTTALGEFLFEVPNAALVAETLEITPSFSANKHLVYSCAAEPNLRDGDLQRAYEVFDPEDIVDKIFLPGEITKIANLLLDKAGFKNRITAKIYDEIKN